MAATGVCQRPLLQQLWWAQSRQAGSAFALHRPRISWRANGRCECQGLQLVLPTAHEPGKGGGPWPRLLRPRRSSAFTRRAHPRPQPPPRWAVMLSFTFSAQSLPSPSHTLCQKEVTSANFPRGRPLPAHLQKRLHDLNNLTGGEVCPPACGRLRVRTCEAPAPGAATPRPPCRGGRSRCELVPKENRMRL